MKQMQTGFSLVELLISVAIFAGIMGTFFSVISSIQRAERFRDTSTVLTQAASYGFEPLVRAVREADGVECVSFAGQKYFVRGFYVRNQDPSIIQSGDITLTTLTSEQERLPGNASQVTLVRRDYAVTPGNILTETTYRAVSANVAANNKTCSETITWGEATQTRQLTPTSVAVSRFDLRVLSPLLLDQLPAGVVRQAPFTGIELVVDYASPKKGISPVTLKTTVGPTFSYGERRD